MILSLNISACISKTYAQYHHPQKKTTIKRQYDQIVSIQNYQIVL